MCRWRGRKKTSVGSPNASGRAGCHRSLACRYASGVAPHLFKLPINAHCRGVHPQVWGWWTCCRCGYMVCVKTSRGFPGSILHLLFTTGMMTWRMKQCRGGGAGKAQTAVLPAAIYTSLPITIPTTPTWVCCFFFCFFFCCATIMSVCHSLAQRLAGIDGGGGGAILDCTQSCPDCHVVVLGFDK